MLRLFCVVLLLKTFACGDQSYPIPRGAQIRLTKKGLQYAASIGIRKLHQELTNKNIDSQSGSGGDVSWSAKNIFIGSVRVGTYSVTPIPNVGLRLYVGGVSVDASCRVSFRYQRGWIKIGDSTNVKIKGRGLGFSVDVKIGENSGKPTLGAIGCSSSISDVDLDFSGGLSWIYNLFSSLLEGKLKRLLKDVMCKEGRKLINQEANKFLSTFPVRQNIKNYAIIDYSFQSPVITNSFIDLLLRGECLNRYNPVPGKTTPPSFNTISSSDKMVYVWLSGYTLNSAGTVLHKSGLLKKLISPIDNLIPANVKPFLNTKSFEQLIPELYQKFPDLQIQFPLETYAPPTFKVTPGKIDVNLYVKATIEVLFANKTTLPIFYLKLHVNAAGSVAVKTQGDQLNVGGNIADFSFGATVGGSIIGDIHVPVDNKSIKDLVRGLVVDQANPLLNKGFPIPNVKGLNFREPQVSFVQDAIRVDTDVAYSGPLLR